MSREILKQIDRSIIEAIESLSETDNTRPFLTAVHQLFLDRMANTPLDPTEQKYTGQIGNEHLNRQDLITAFLLAYEQTSDKKHLTVDFAQRLRVNLDGKIYPGIVLSYLSIDNGLLKGVDPLFKSGYTHLRIAVSNATKEFLREKYQLRGVVPTLQDVWDNQIAILAYKRNFTPEGLRIFLTAFGKDIPDVDEV